MRRGCISLGNIKCDQCSRQIPYPERYLSMEEVKGKSQTLCIGCCQEKGLVRAGSAKEEAEHLFDLNCD